MIFNCPSCSAGHSVPASTIPSDGVEMSCRRCSTAFRVEAPEKTQLGAVVLGDDEPEGQSTDSLLAQASTDEEAEHPLGEPEATSVGVVSPFEFESSEPSLLRSPSGVAIPKSERSSVRRSSVGLVVDREGAATFSTPVPTVPHQGPRRATPVTGGHAVPLGPDEVGFDPELDETAQNQTGSDDVPSPRVVRDQTDVGDLGPSGAPSPKTRSRGTGGVEERVAARAQNQDDRRGLDPSSEPPRARDPKEGRGRESPLAIPTATKTGMFLPLRNVTETFREPSMTLKAALIVVPLLVGAFFVFGPGRDPWAKDPIEIVPKPGPAASGPRAGPDVVPGIAAPQLAVGEPGPPSAEAGGDSPAGRAPGSRLGRGSAAVDPNTRPDAPLEPATSGEPGPAGGDGALFVLERSRLRVGPNETSAAIARVNEGDRVRAYARIDGYAFVLVLPRGPGGFLGERFIGPSRTAAVAPFKAFAFVQCETRVNESRDDCLFRSKTQYDACVDTCVTDPRGRLKCEGSCTAGFDDCKKACNRRR